MPLVRVPVVRELLGPGGAVRAGVLGVALDVFGGNLAVEAAAPDWALTAQLELHVLRPLTRGTLCVTGHPLRAGRTNLVAEARVDDGEASRGGRGDTIRRRSPHVHARAGAGGEPPRARRGGLLYAFAEAAERLAAPFHAAIGLRELEAASGAVELSLVPYVANSVGALQGGLAVALADASAECAGRALLGREVATSRSPRPLPRARPRRPFRTRAALLRRERDAALFSVELRDAGQEDRLAERRDRAVAAAARRAAELLLDGCCLTE